MSYSNIVEDKTRELTKHLDNFRNDAAWFDTIIGYGGTHYYENDSEERFVLFNNGTLYIKFLRDYNNIWSPQKSFDVSEFREELFRKELPSKEEFKQIVDSN